MKKGILCILLSIFLILPVFTACDKGSTSTGTKATIYTFYTIVEEATTEDSIRQVELALNRTLFYRYGIILDIKTAKSEEEYYKLIDDTFEKMENKSEDNKKDSSSDKVFTGDDILKMLEDNKPIPDDTANPRLDIFLVTDFDRYYEYAQDGKLTALDSALNNEAKNLTAEIHSTFFKAAKVNGSVYGFPINSPIGQNTYFVFDKELFDEQDVIDISTINSLKDLEGYLALVKDSHEDVIPLKNLGKNNDANFLVNEGFPAIVKDGAVKDAYTDANLTKYLTMISKYNALGYIGNPETDGADARYAVKIEERDVKCDHKHNCDKDLECKCDHDNGIYVTDNEIIVKNASPVATIDNTVQGLYCISKYVSSNELTEILNIYSTICTEKDLINLMIYGVEGIHYELNDDGQVHRLTDANGKHTYEVNPYYMGNPFKAYTLEGEAKNKWDLIIEHNRTTVASPTLGYITSYTSWPYENEDGKADTLYEPDYVEIVNTVISKYYTNALSDGSWLIDEFKKNNSEDALIETEHTNYAELIAQCQEDSRQELTEELINYYVDKVITPILRVDIEAEVRDVNSELYQSIYAEELAKVQQDAIEYPDIYPDEQAILAQVEKNVQKALDTEINNRVKAIVGEQDLDSLELFIANNEKLAPWKDQFISDKNELETIDLPKATNEAIDAVIKKYLKSYINAMVDEINATLETEINKFYDTYKDALKWDSKEDFYCAIGYYKKVTGEASSSESEDTSSEGETSEEDSADSYEALYDSWYDFVLEGKIASSYKTSFESEAA